MNIIVFIIGLIMLLGIGIPVSQDIIADSNLTGISSTIVSFIPMFLALSALILAAKTGGMM